MIRLAPGQLPPKVAADEVQASSFWGDMGRWIAAGMVVLAVHAAGAYAIYAAREDDQSHGEVAEAMFVELAPEPMAPAEEQVSEIAQPETAVEPQETFEPDEAPKEVAEAEPQSEPDLESERPQMEEPEEIIPDMAEALKPEVAIPLPATKPQTKPKREVAKIRKPEPERVETANRAERVKSKQAAKAKENRQGSAPRIDADSGPKAVATRQGVNSASAGQSSAKWTSKLQAHMARNVRFLQRRSKNAKGLVRVTFVIDPSGKVLSASLAGSSGDSTVDKLALEAARRASPVPAPPPAIAQSRLPITLPLLFK